MCVCQKHTRYSFDHTCVFGPSSNSMCVLHFPKCVFVLFPNVCFTFPKCVFHVSQMCVSLFPNVCFTFPKCVFYFSQMCVSPFPNVCFAFPKCVFHFSQMCVLKTTHVVSQNTHLGKLKHTYMCQTVACRKHIRVPKQHIWAIQNTHVCFGCQNSP